MSRAQHVLAADIRQRINRLSHVAGAKHAETVRAALLSQFEALAAAGTRHPELEARLFTIESQK